MPFEYSHNMRQLNFKIKKQKQTFGGSNLKSSPKEKRPLETKSAMHLTLKAQRSVLRLPKTMRLVNGEIERACRKYDFTLYKYSNNFNHLHLLIRVTNRYRWQSFIRELTGRIAQALRNLMNIDGTFWLGRPFTRILRGWGKNYRQVKEYIDLNILEAEQNLTRAQSKIFKQFKEIFAEP